MCWAPSYSFSIMVRNCNQTSERVAYISPLYTYSLTPAIWLLFALFHQICPLSSHSSWSSNYFNLLIFDTIEHPFPLNRARQVRYLTYKI